MAHTRKDKTLAFMSLLFIGTLIGFIIYALVLERNNIREELKHSHYSLYK